MKLKRLRGWPEKLFAYIESRRHTPFAWHENDCWSFPAGAILAITGEDLFAPYRGRYSDEAGAAALIAEAGGMRALCPLESKQLGFAQRGDVVLALIEGRETAGVIAGGGAWCAPGAAGLVFRPLRGGDVIDVMAV